MTQRGQFRMSFDIDGAAFLSVVRHRLADAARDMLSDCGRIGENWRKNAIRAPQTVDFAIPCDSWPPIRRRGSLPSSPGSPIRRKRISQTWCRGIGTVCSRVNKLRKPRSTPEGYIKAARCWSAVASLSKSSPDRNPIEQVFDAGRRSAACEETRRRPCGPVVVLSNWGRVLELRGKLALTGHMAARRTSGAAGHLARHRFDSIRDGMTMPTASDVFQSAQARIFSNSVPATSTRLDLCTQDRKADLPL